MTFSIVVSFTIYYFLKIWPTLILNSFKVNTYFATIDMFHSCLSEEKIDMFLILQSVHKIRS